jgi:hypothetical protein
MNFFTYLLLGNNTDRKLALLNVTTDSNALASLWNPPKLLRSSTQLPEPVVAVTCQIMSWILIWLQHGPQYLKKYNPSKKNSAIGGDGGDAVKNRALLTLQSVPLTTKAWEKKSPVAKTRGPTGDVYTEADYDDFINQICCLLNAAFRFIEASNIKSKRLTRSNYGKKVRDDGVKDMGCGSGNVSKEACLSCDGANPKNTKIGKTRTYGAVMDKIRSTIGFFDSSRRSGLRSNKLLGDINNCLKRYYCDEKWVEFGLDKPCNPERSVRGGGYKRTKKKRRRRHTRRRRRRRKRKTRHRKQRRRRRRRTRR